MRPEQKWLRSTLQKKGFSKSFVALAMKTYDESTYEPVLKLNILGFLLKSNHMNLVTDDGISKSQAFIQNNHRTFADVEKRYHVPAEVIASLLWIETRQGELKGNFHVPSVFLHLLQGERESARSALLKIAQTDSKYENELSRKELIRKIRERTKQRSLWALGELKALDKMHKRKADLVASLKGSFAGAFGLPQFVPSSYLEYARAHKGKGTADLFKAADAIESVGRYLKQHGWKSGRAKSHVKALMAYNNSRDYADSILAMSRKLSGQSKEPIRATSSVDSRQEVKTQPHRDWIYMNEDP
jgi:membrane-bound lytic murein transglycosylase B